MHHSLHHYKNTFSYKLYESNWSRFVRFTELRIKIAVIIFFIGILLFIVGTLMSRNILCSTWIFLTVVLLPCSVSSMLTEKELCFSLNMRIEGNRVYSQGYPLWLLRGCVVFVNLMVVGSLALCLFCSTCYAFADNKIVEECVYVKEVEKMKRHKKYMYISYFLMV